MVDEDYGSVSRDTDQYTIQEALDYSGCGLGNFLAIGCALGVNVAEGFEGVVLAIILPKLRCEWNLSDFMTIMIPVTYFITKCFGSLFIARLIDYYGRLMTLQIGQFLFALFAVLTAFSQNVWQFIVFRMFVGMFMEFSTCSAPVYAIELSPSGSRALVGMGVNVSWGIGGFGVTVLCYFFLESLGWRYILVLTAIPAIIFAVLLLFQRESPYYEVARGRLTEAQGTLDMIFKYNKTTPMAGTLAVHNNVEDPYEFTLLDYFNSKDRILTSVYIVIVNMCMFFTFVLMTWGSPRLLSEGYCHAPPKVLRDNCHTYTKSSLFDLSVITFVETFGSVAFYFSTDTLGRLVTLRGGAIATAIFSFTALFCAGKIKLLVELSVIRFLNAGLFYTSLLYTTEYYPTHVRGTTTAGIYGIGRLVAVFAIALTIIVESDEMWLIIAASAVVGCVMTLFTFLLSWETKDTVII